MSTSIIYGVMRSNGFEQVRGSNNDTWIREVLALRTMQTYQIIVHNEEDDSATLYVRNRTSGQPVARKQDTPEEVYSDAVALAHNLSK